MIAGLLGKKIGMTHLFGADSQVVPVTVLQVGPCVVTQVRTAARDGYDAVQIGFGEAKQLTKPARGHLKASGAQVRHLREFAASDASDYLPGQVLSVAQFQAGDLVDVASRTKGRGFQGAMKRHGFAGGPKSHGQKDRNRAVGSIGAGTFPGRVVKGKKMPGHMGNRRVTVRKLRVVQVDEERNLLLVRGAVPGSRNSLVTVLYARGVPLAERVAAEAAPAPEPAEEPEAMAAAADAQAEPATAEETAAEEQPDDRVDESAAVEETPADDGEQSPEEGAGPAAAVETGEAPKDEEKA